MNMMARGAAMVRRKLNRHASHAVTYTDGDSVSIQVVASIGIVEVASSDSEGFVVRSRMRDFLVDVAYMVADEVPLVPTPGWLLIDRGHQYQIIPIGDEPCWRWSDLDHLRYRIHTHYEGPV